MIYSEDEKDLRPEEEMPEVFPDGTAATGPGEEEAKASSGPSAEAQEAQEAKADGEEAKEEEDDAAAKLDKVSALLAVKEEENKELQNRLLRLQADFDNFRRRNAQERKDLSSFVTVQVVEKFLKVLDNFERAEQSAEAATDVESLKEGFSSMHKQFLKVLDDLKVKEIPAQGEKFDPNLHEAVMRGQNPELEDDTIDMVLEKGYEMDGRVVRHSKVRVVSNE